MSGKSLPDYGSLDYEKSDGIIINNMTDHNRGDDSVAISIPVPICGENVQCAGGADFEVQDLVRETLVKVKPRPLLLKSS